MMKRIRIKYMLLLGIGIVLLSQYSCNKSLELKPLDQISDATFWNSANDFMLAANKFYTFQKTFADIIYDVVPNTTRQNYHADFKADIMGTPNTYSRGVNTVPTSDANYDLAYSRIRDINNLLGKAAAYSIPEDIKKYVAEAKFFRAYIYFDLLQVFGPTTILTSTLDPTSPALQAARPGRDTVVDFIISDLNAAIADLPLESAILAADKGRVSKGSAQAFLSRVALYEGTWQKFRSGTASRYNALLDMAVSASGSVIASNEYALFAPAALGDSAQKYLFILENQKSNPASITKASNKEYIQANRYDFTLRQINNNVSRSASTDLTRQFVNLYLCSDGLPIEKSTRFQGYSTMISEYQNRDNRLRYNVKIAGGYYWYGNNNWHINWDWSAPDLANADASPWKPYANSLSGYKSQKWISERQVQDNQEAEDYPVIRYAEVLLNYAEAVYERNGNITDADLDKSLNLVRNRVNKTMPKLSNALVSGNGLDMRREIRRERTIEFYNEGFRMDDLKRWHNAIGGPALGGTDEDILIGANVLKLPLLGVKWAGTEFQSTWANQSTTSKYTSSNSFLDGAIIVDAARAFGEKNYLLPIPSTQIQLNSNLKQNTGW